MRKTIFSIVTGLVLSFASSNMAVLANNPGTQGQPNANCETSSNQPAGFSTSGFKAAKLVYAGSGESTEQPSSPNAVSQYDVACFQLSSH